MIGLSRKERARYRLLIDELCRLSRNGWAHARPSDYQPLEAEYRALAAKIARSR